MAVISSASGNGKTALGRRLAAKLDVPFVELDALVHGPNWTETPDDKPFALGAHRQRRLRTPAEVDRFLSAAVEP